MAYSCKYVGGKRELKGLFNVARGEKPGTKNGVKTWHMPKTILRLGNVSDARSIPI